MNHPILLYDGVCGLCNRLVQFVLRRDQAGLFRFAALQSELAARVLARHGAEAGKMDTVGLVIDYEMPDERILVRSDAVIFVLRQLGAWRMWARLIELVPRVLREWGYRFVARHRYRVFGRHDACLLPDQGQRERFLG